MKRGTGCMMAALFALAGLAGTAKAEYSSRTGGQLIGLSSMTGDVQGGFMDGRDRSSVSSLDCGDGYQSNPCDRYDGSEYAACTDGYNGYGCSDWSGDDWWACEYGQTAQQSNNTSDSTYSSGGGGGAVDPVSGLLFAAFAGVGAAAKRRRKE